MPGNVQGAAPSGVMPYSLCTAFAEAREYAQLQAQYHDGTTERSQLAQTSRRTFKLAQRLTASIAATNFGPSVQSSDNHTALGVNFRLHPRLRRFQAARASMCFSQ